MFLIKKVDKTFTYTNRFLYVYLADKRNIDDLLAKTLVLNVKRSPFLIWKINPPDIITQKFIVKMIGEEAITCLADGFEERSQLSSISQERKHSHHASH